jgi:hypothetical protein
MVGRDVDDAAAQGAYEGPDGHSRKHQPLSVVRGGVLSRRGLHAPFWFVPASPTVSTRSRSLPLCGAPYATPRRQYQSRRCIWAGVLAKQVELLAMEEHLGVSLGQQGTEPWLRVCSFGTLMTGTGPGFDSPLSSSWPYLVQCRVEESEFSEVRMFGILGSSLT